MREIDNLSYATLEMHALHVLDKGVFISKSKYKNYEISLYRLDEAFIEIWFNRTLDQLERVDSLEDKSINPFLKHFAADLLN